MSMEDTESTTRERATAKDGNQDTDNRVLMTSKPLHRYVQKDPRALGIVIVILGCAELLMGFQLASETIHNSNKIYIPFWQGVLFLVCGNLSIYTEVHTSKKMVTVCLAMYIVTLLGVILSVGFRIVCLLENEHLTYRWGKQENEWNVIRVMQITCIESILCTASVCVFVILIFLCCVTRLALKSTRTQVIVQHISAPRSDTASD
ncbi:membrane-spanning 4-domains subfamily A member 4D-like [Xyrichtys novacula]|nr:membrane-spanning 4-domains subfamily A member 4D-like [Xyrichtys novacula]